MRFRGRVAIVTGGASGIGAATCRLLAAEGAAVAVVDWQREAAEQCAAELPQASAFVADVSDPSAVDEVVRDVVDRYGCVDVLVNVAGIADLDNRANIVAQYEAGEPFDITSKLSNEQWRRTLSINLDGAFYFLRVALRDMLPRQSGAIVNMASLAGVSGTPNLPHYSASKAGLIALTQSVAKEVAGRHIRVNAIAPGAVATPMTATAPMAAHAAAIPLGRAATADEIARVVLFLASDDASYITGETINVNGGLLAI